MFVYGILNGITVRAVPSKPFHFFDVDQSKTIRHTARIESELNTILLHRRMHMIYSEYVEHTP